MNIHQKTPALPHISVKPFGADTKQRSISSLARRFMVSRPAIYRVLKAARIGLLKPQNSTHNRFKQARYGMKWLVKVERQI